MQKILHSDLAAGRWFQLSLVEQLANIGSEVGRAINWQKRGDEEQKERALERCLELFDLTVSDSRWRHRLKEITRMREILKDFFYGDNEYKSTAESLDKYFYYFAYAARNR